VCERGDELPECIKDGEGNLLGGLAVPDGLVIRLLVTEQRKTLHNAERRDLYCIPNIIRAIKLRDTCSTHRRNEN
jgi:hypothetical protein